MRKLTAQEKKWSDSHRRAQAPSYCSSWEGMKKCRRSARWYMAHDDGYIGSPICREHAVRTLNEVRRIDPHYRLLPAWVAMGITVNREKGI